MLPMIILARKDLCSIFQQDHRVLYIRTSNFLKDT